jgi:hypothetical protein
MFRNKLKYYHGTSTERWERIKEDKNFKPSHIKKVGEYWITKGIYFVCENPYIALWYAHVASIKDNSEPVVLCIEYEADKENTGEILNLLTSDGHKVLAIAHSMYSEKVNLKGDSLISEENENLDSVSLQLLMNNTKSLKAIIASFQEGKSFQNILHEHNYVNRFVPSQKGFSPGDHIEICFYPVLDLDELNITALNKADVLMDSEPCCIWDCVCNGLTDPLDDSDFKNRLKESLSN